MLMQWRRALIIVLPALAVLVVRMPHRAQAGGGCRSNPMANVWSPSRLKILSSCSTVHGTVRSTAREGDGDIHIEMTLDSGARIRAEIVPADQPGCTKGEKVRYGVCTGANIATPKAGSKIYATGPKVKDTRNGGTEIHPAWQIIKG
jgi:hypothetical protein